MHFRLLAQRRIYLYGFCAELPLNTPVVLLIQLWDHVLGISKKAQKGGVGRAKIVLNSRRFACIDEAKAAEHDVGYRPNIGLYLYVKNVEPKKTNFKTRFYEKIKKIKNVQ